MTTKEVLQKICNDSGISMSTMSTTLGLSRSAVSKAMQENEGMSMRLDTLIKWIETYGCQLYVIDLDGNEMLLDGENEG